MDRKLRLVYLVGSRLSFGGVENYILNLIDGISSKYEIIFIGSASDEFRNEIQNRSVDFVQWNTVGAYDIRSFRTLRRLIEQIEPNIIHIHDPRAGFIGRLALKSFRLPIIYTIHYPAYNYVDFNPILGWLIRRIYKLIEKILNPHFSSRVIFASKKAFEDALRDNISRKNITLHIPNSIDGKSIAHQVSRLDRVKLRKKLGVKKKTKVICAISRLAPEKNIELSLRAIKKLSLLYDIRFWIIGDGPSRSKLEYLVGDLQLDDIVTFFGYQPEVINFLYACDIFVFTSMYEARPSVVMEAQSVGKPSVVSNVGDNPYLVKHGDDGFLISPQDEKKLIEYLEELIKDEVLRQRMGRAAMIKAKSEYSILGMIDDHIDIYQQVDNHSLILV